MDPEETAEGTAQATAGLCPVCGEPQKTGSQRCEKCESFYSWKGNCRCCGAPVPEDATVCHECGRHPHSTSRWRRFQESSQGVLSLLVALFSVTGTIIALLSGLTFFHTSSTEVSSPKFPPEAGAGKRGLTIEVVAYNSGNSSALINGARLVSSFDGAEWITQLDLAPLRIKPDDLQTVNLTLTGGLDLQPFKIDSQTGDRYQSLLDAPHRIEVGIKEFGEERAWKEVSGVSAPELRKWLFDVTVKPYSRPEATRKP